MRANLRAVGDDAVPPFPDTGTDEEKRKWLAAHPGTPAPVRDVLNATQAGIDAKEKAKLKRYALYAMLAYWALKPAEASKRIAPLAALWVIW